MDTDLRAAAMLALKALEDSCAPRLSTKHYAAYDEAITALRAALERPSECRWLQDGDEDSGTYMASCNQRYFSVVDGTPKDNHMEHCCYCGKPLVEVPIEPEDNHE